MYLRTYVRTCVCACVRMCVRAYVRMRVRARPRPSTRCLWEWAAASTAWHVLAVIGATGGTARAAAATATFGTGGGRRGGWLWPDRDRHPATLTRVWVCEALPSEMQGGGEMATSLRRDGTHVSGNAAATTAEPTHTNTTEMAAAATTRRAAGQE